jgi:SAM-dependent methyltransferase
VSEIVTERTFNEEWYLNSNPDVRTAVEKGEMPSGWFHYLTFGRKETRTQRNSLSIEAMRKRKARLIEEIIDKERPYKKTGHKFDFLTKELKNKFGIVDTANIASDDYDSYVMELFEENHSGIFLDCGAGMRNVYYSNVINFEIVDYDTTDVLGVGESLPFRDNVFDGIVSLAVLEHVKDPFLCAREISRVLKPGGRLICAAPFLQPYHAYPGHYFNMSYQGLVALFEKYLDIEKLSVTEKCLPVCSLAWIINSWAQGLPPDVSENFLNMRLREFCLKPSELINRDFVKQLSEEKKYELASGTVLFARKKMKETGPGI